MIKEVKDQFISTRTARFMFINLLLINLQDPFTRIKTAKLMSTKQLRPKDIPQLTNLLQKKMIAAKAKWLNFRQQTKIYSILKPL
jgi:hypothetical protein